MSRTETRRFYVDTAGRDDDALRLAFSWLQQEALASPPGVVAVPGLRNVDSLPPGLSVADAQKLRREKRIMIRGAEVLLMTDRIEPPLREVGAVLGVWIDDKALERIEAVWPAAICVVPWLREAIERWRENWSPVDLRSGRAAVGKAEISNPVVEQALETLTSHVNLSTGLGHPSDRAAAIRLFEILRAGGESYEPAEVRAWAAQNRWSASGASELEEIARGVLEGRRFRVERFGWREDIIEVWRNLARNSSSS